MIRIGVIGAGKFGTNLLNAFTQLQREGKCTLAAVCDIDEKTLEKQAAAYETKGYTDFAEMLDKEDLEGVAIATPDPFHREPVLRAAERGLHVFVEKPMDVTEEGCREMIEACRAAKVLLQVDFHKRFDPYHQEIEQNLRQGKIGRVEYGYAHMEDRIEVPSRWFPGWAGKSSPVWFLAVHFIDLVRWMLKSDGKTAYARGTRWKLKEMGVDTYDAVSAMVEFHNGAVVTFDVSWILPDRFEAVVNQGLRLVGENGIIECDSQDRGTRVCFDEEGMMTYNLGFLKKGKDKFGRVRYSGYGIESIEDFVYNLEYLQQGGSLESMKSAVTGLGNDGLEATKIALAIHRSLESGAVESV